MLTTLAGVAQIVSAVAVAVAVAFGLVQVRQLRQQRRDLAGIELLRMVRDRELSAAMRAITSGGPNRTVEDIRARGPEYIAAARQVIATFEMVGLLVYKRTVPFDLVVQFMGHGVVSLWGLLHPLIQESRGAPMGRHSGEWFEWLAERMREHLELEPSRLAATVHARWRPGD